MMQARKTGSIRPSTTRTCTPRSYFWQASTLGLPLYKQLQRWSLLLLVLAAILGAVGCSGTLAPTECEDGKVLKDGKCVAPTPDGPCNDTDRKCSGENPKCLDGTCVAQDYCAKAGDCVGGRCDVEKNKCVPYRECENNDFCEGNDEHCYGGFCQPDEKICELLNCAAPEKGGVCDVVTGACVDAQDCAGDDTKCTKGKFCNINTCKSNLCDASGQCPQGGVCDRATGQCVDKETCAEDDDCAGGKKCAKSATNADGKCKTKEMLCEDIGGCPGNQECKRDTDLVVTCNEPKECVTSLDCKGANVCNYNAAERKFKCGAATTCEDDAKEGNNDAGSATDFSKKAVDGKIKKLALCNDDWFVFDTTSVKNGPGNLSVLVEISPNDIGAKPVTVEIFKADAAGTAVSSTTPVKTGTNYEGGKYTSGNIVVNYSYTEPGKYFIKISTESEDKNLNYTLHVTATDENVIDACDDATELPLNQMVTGTPNNGFTELSTSCVEDFSGSVEDKIYHLKIEERSFVTIDVRPQESNRTIDPVIEIRGECTVGSSVLKKGCSNSAGGDKRESLSQVLEPGDYYVIVTFYSQDTTGGYKILATTQATGCTDAENQCESGGPGDTVSNYCDSTQTQMLTERCDRTLGCNPDTGRCNTTPGSSCSSAFTVDVNTPSVSKTIKGFSNFSNDFNGLETCPMASGQSSGNDIVFFAEVPDGHVLTAEITSDGNYVAFLTSDCDVFSKDTCLKDGQVSRPTGAAYPGVLVYNNTSGETQSFFLVVDHDVSSAPPSFIKVDVALNERRCEPNSSRCGPGGRESVTCNIYGTGGATSEDCNNLGCNATTGKCNLPKGDRCDNPIEIANLANDTPVTVNGTLVGMHDLTPVDVERGCGTLPNATSAKGEAVYKLTTEPGNSYKITVNGSYLSLWTSDSCDDTTGALRSCADGSTTSVTLIGGTEVEEHYIVVSSYYDNQIPFSLEVVRSDISRANSRSTCDGNNISVYDSKGAKTTHTCAVACQNYGNEGHCTNGNGHTCFEAKTLYPDPTDATKKRDLAEGEFSIAGAGTGSDLDVMEGHNGACYFNERKNSWSSEGAFPRGKDIFYRFVLQKDEILNVQITGGLEIEKTIAFFMSDCRNAETCSGTVGGDGLEASTLPRSMAYRATANDESVFLVFKRTEDASAGGSENVEFAWNIVDDPNEMPCPTNRVECIDDETLVICDGGGKEPAKKYTCKHGCKDAACNPSPSKGDSCTDAIEVYGGGVFIVKPGELSNQGSVDSAACSFSSASLEGNDAFYKVTTTKDAQVIKASLINLIGKVPSVYIFSDCNNIRGTCADGRTGGYGTQNPAKAEAFVAKAGTTYYIAADVERFSNKGLQYLTIDVVDAECDPAVDGASCEAGEIKMCADGKWVTTPCASGVCEDTPTVKCTTGGTGTSCFDALALTSDESLLNHQFLTSLRSQDSFTNRISAGEVVDGCIFRNLSSGSMPIGKEKYYSIDLKQGDHLKAELWDSETNPHFNASKLIMYVMKGCGLGETCMASTVGSSDYGVTFAPIDFVAPEDGTYFIVVDSIAAIVGNTWTLKWKVTRKDTDPAVCTGSAGYCDQATGKLIRCVDNKYVEVTCAHGCSFGKCNVDVSEIDQCSTAPTIENGFAANLALDTSTYTDTVNLNAGNLCLPGLYTYRKDAFFKVELGAFDKVNTYVYRANPSDRVAVFYTSSCFLMNSNCLSGGVTTLSNDGIQGPYSYQASSSPETVYLGIDGISKYDDPHAIQLYVEVDRMECNPTDPPAPTCEDGNKLKYCNSTAQHETYDCVCETVDGRGVCTTQQGDACYDAIDVDFGTETSVERPNETFVGASNTYNMGVGNMCTDYATEGVDRVYRVKVPAGKTLTASAKSTNALPKPYDDLAIYIASNCNQVPKTCVTRDGDQQPAEVDNAGTKEAGLETVEYGPTTAEEVVYVIVDGRYANNNTGEYAVRFTLQ